MSDAANVMSSSSHAIHAAHLAGGLAACFWLFARRALLFRLCPRNTGLLAERHVSWNTLLALARSSPRVLDLSFARSSRGSFFLRRHRGVFALEQLARLGISVERLVLDGCTLGELDLARLAPSLQSLQCLHSALLLSGSVGPSLLHLRLSGNTLRLGASFSLSRALAQLRVLELHLSPEYCVPQTVSVPFSPLRRLSIDGPILELRVAQAPLLVSLHLGVGARLLCPPLGPTLVCSFLFFVLLFFLFFLAKLSLGVADSDAFASLGSLPSSVRQLYLDIDTWPVALLPALSPLFPELRELVVRKGSSQQLVALFANLPPSLAVLRLIDCTLHRNIKLPAGCRVSVETTDTTGSSWHVPTWLFRRLSNKVSARK
jgi:hypothetical protein